MCRAYVRPIQTRHGTLSLAVVGLGLQLVIHWSDRPSRVHGRHLGPLLANGVEAAHAVEVVHAVEAADQVDQHVNGGTAVVGARTCSVQ